MTKHLVSARLFGIWALVVGLVFGGPAFVVGQTVGGGEVEKRTTTVLRQGKWSTSFAAVKARAEKSEKLIFWVQLVGELDGGL